MGGPLTVAPAQPLPEAGAEPRGDVGRPRAEEPAEEPRGLPPPRYVRVQKRRGHGPDDRGEYLGGDPVQLVRHGVHVRAVVVVVPVVVDVSTIG